MLVAVVEVIEWQLGLKFGAHVWINSKAVSCQYYEWSFLIGYSFTFESAIREQN